ncbi:MULTISPECIES: CaiB/BaiF CoA transferase family protein [Aerococcus]|uniref:CaiB/BaiF CoA transferase family protein n=1 Tax=Aerococcus TaxID=1375 RepID=UPI0015EC7DBF|nr:MULTISPECIES: CoA transferase [Aerococcus]MDK6688187.1 CoA transferase [Aerococcus urinae]MDK8132693.1 CoA transferase [Aerococcus urinae]MDK8484386.1 CoA transferase [Aerococcus urinae]MDL5179331.1 CoA transferase [Aerococcus tenax]MDL5208232.1 CoA transferase [Aerococcus tenax]
MIELLKGVKVVDFTTMVAAPAAAKMMADWGAEVVKVEAPGGEVLRVLGASMGAPAKAEENPIFDLYNANKKGVTLDLKTSAGLEVMDRLIAWADIFISNVRLESLRKLGLDYATLSAKYPSLVWTHFSGYGLQGEEAGRPGYDMAAYWSRGGFVADLSPEGEHPLHLPTGIGDGICGLALLSGTLGALRQAEQTGQGQEVRVSLYGTAIYANGVQVISTQYQDVFPKPYHRPTSPLMHSYRTKNDEIMVIVLPVHDKGYPQLMKLLEREDLIADERYATQAAMANSQYKEELTHILEEAFAQFDSQTLSERFLAADITFERARHFEEIAHDPQAQANHYLYDYQFANGNHAQMPTSPVQFSDNLDMPYQAAPLVGENNQEVLEALGYGAEEITALKDQGAFGKSRR